MGSKKELRPEPTDEGRAVADPPSASLRRAGGVRASDRTGHVPKHSGKHQSSFTYHPFEVTFCGYSGSGKTTLVAKLLRKWSAEYKVGFVKHDAHRFEMDKAGKDTHTAAEAGAASVMINDPRHFARISSLPYSRFEKAQAFTDCDFVISEGFKQSKLPKLLLLDAGGRGWTEYGQGDFENVLALIGPDERPADLAHDVPYFHRDDVETIAEFVESYFGSLAKAPLYGLVLIGGESRRMGRPKWQLEYTGENQAQRAVRLLDGVCDRTFLSLRETQKDSDLLPDAPHIYDRFPAWGPLTGILSAMHESPDAAWLVVACDLPFLDEVTLDFLVKNRLPYRIATAFQSANDGLPEPLCTIWEKRSVQRLLQAAGLGLTCPRKVLIESTPKILTLPKPAALDNANTPEEFKTAVSKLNEVKRA